MLLCMCGIDRGEIGADSTIGVHLLFFLARVKYMLYYEKYIILGGMLYEKSKKGI